MAKAGKSAVSRFMMPQGKSSTRDVRACGDSLSLITGCQRKLQAALDQINVAESKILVMGNDRPGMAVSSWIKSTIGLRAPARSWYRTREFCQSTPLIRRPRVKW
jgi:hypothetical protein